MWDGALLSMALLNSYPETNLAVSCVALVPKGCLLSGVSFP